MQPPSQDPFFGLYGLGGQEKRGPWEVATLNLSSSNSSEPSRSSEKQ